MFTGIIEEVGAVKQITHGQHSEVLNIQARTVLENTKIGDSIAVNGICLTVTRLFADSFSADVMHETLNRSSLAGLMVGSRVNLERAMAADGRFGGHIVAYLRLKGQSGGAYRVSVGLGLPVLNGRINTAFYYDRLQLQGNALRRDIMGFTVTYTLSEKFYQVKL